MLQRSIDRVTKTPSLRPGFGGERHKAALVVAPGDLPSTDPSFLMADDNITLAGPFGAAHPHAGLERRDARGHSRVMPPAFSGLARRGRSALPVGLLRALVLFHVDIASKAPHREIVSAAIIARGEAPCRRGTARRRGTRHLR